MTGGPSQPSNPIVSVLPRRWRAPVERVGPYIFWLAVAAVIVAWAAACLHGIANVWQWGHNGYNGAAFAQAARNSLRFETLAQAQYYTGLEPPDSSLFYTHHPMLLHFHLMALFHQFGYSETIGRLVPAVYSIATLPLLFVAARRYFGNAVALVAIAVYTLTPLNLIYANMINHEQGSIFWCLFFVYCYARWVDTKRWRYFALVMLGVSMAVQFDWVGYYLALIVVLHAFVTGLRSRRGIWRWRPEYTFVSVFSVVVLGNFGVFLDFILQVRGNLHEMFESFRVRASNPTGYLSALWHRSQDLHGPLLLTLLAIWVALTVVRARQRRLRLGDLIPISFFVAQLVHSALFKQAGYIHAYWPYHLSPALAIGVGIVAMEAIRCIPPWIAGWLDRRMGHRAGSGFRDDARRAATAAVLAALAVLFVSQSAFAIRKHSWGFRTGAASYMEPYDDQYLQIRWIQDVTTRFNRDNAFFLIHPSVDWRIEWLAYLDAPYEQTWRTDLTSEERRSDRHTVLLADLSRMPSRRPVSELVEGHRTWVYDRRFVVVDASNDEAELTALTHVAEEPSLWWRWLVNPNRPPVRWAPDTEDEAVRRLFSTWRSQTVEETFGGEGGVYGQWDCPAGQVLSGFLLSLLEDPAAPALAHLQPRCRWLRRSQDRPEGSRRDSVFGGPSFGHPATGRRDVLSCPDQHAVVGIQGYQRPLPESLGLYCARILAPSADEAFRLGEAMATPIVGGLTGKHYEFLCPQGSVGWGFRGRSGVLIDAIGISCAYVDDAFLGESPYSD